MAVQWEKVMLWWSIRATGYGFQSWLRISTPEKIVHVANTFQSVYFKQHSSLDVYLFRFYHFAITGWDFVLFCKFFVYCVTVIRCVYPGQACLAMRQESRRAMPSYTQLTITYHQMQLLMNSLSHIPGFQTKKNHCNRQWYLSNASLVISKYYMISRYHH